MKVGLVQYDPVWEKIDENMDKLSSMLEKSGEKCDLLIFPEMTLTGFTMQSEQFCERPDGRSREYFGSLAKLYNAHVIAGLIEKDGTNIFNTSIHLNEKGELLAKYRKIHPFSCSGEDKNYSKGKETVISQQGEWKIGLSICYDLRFPELFRQYGKSRAELIVVIANWPKTRVSHWRALLKARAIENQCYVAGVNRVGVDPLNKYNGFSSLFDPMGEELIAVEDSEAIAVCEISIGEVTSLRSRLPFLNDISLI